VLYGCFAMRRITSSIAFKNARPLNGFGKYALHPSDSASARIDGSSCAVMKMIVPMKNIAWIVVSAGV
jgi:hypothetical protein